MLLLFHLLNFQKVSGANPAFYTTGTGLRFQFLGGLQHIDENQHRDENPPLTRVERNSISHSSTST
jgi:hypothetical protein